MIPSSCWKYSGTQELARALASTSMLNRRHMSTKEDKEDEEDEALLLGLSVLDMFLESAIVTLVVLLLVVLSSLILRQISSTTLPLCSCQRKVKCILSKRLLSLWKDMFSLHTAFNTLRHIADTPDEFGGFIPETPAPHETSLLLFIPLSSISAKIPPLSLRSGLLLSTSAGTSRGGMPETSTSVLWSFSFSRSPSDACHSTNS